MALSNNELQQLAEEVIEFIAARRGELGLPETLTQAWEKFVEAETDHDRRAFGELMADARRQATIQRQLDEDRERLHHRQLSHEENISVGHHYEMLREQACVYNHLLRGVIERHRDQLDRADLVGWLARASQGAREWATAEVVGAISEIALHAALVGVAELTEVRHATVEEDLKGYDFTAQWQGKLVTIDAKTGMYYPLSVHRHGHYHIEISVPHEAVRDFRLTRMGLDILRYEIRQALHHQTGTSRHASHGHYQEHASRT